MTALIAGVTASLALLCGTLAPSLAAPAARMPAGPETPAPAGSRTPGTNAAGAGPEEYERATAYLRRHLDQARIPGLAVAVVRADGVVHRWTWGTDGDGAPVTADTPFLLGSVSKPVTALAVLQLVEAGRVDLDAPVRRYLPWLRLTDESVAERITVRQLLTHRSGLPSIATRGLTDRFDNAPDPLTRAVRELATVPPVAAPGAEHRYSDANYLILGAVVESVTGESFGGYLRRNVLDPLEMTGSATTAAEARAVGLPAGHRYVLGRPVRFASPFDTSGVPYGYLTASLDGLAHFAVAQLNGGRYRDATVLSPAGIARAQTGEAEVGPGHRYGLGWRESTLTGGDVRLVWHAGATPGFFSHVVLAPDSGLGVVLLANGYSPLRDASLSAAAFDVVRILHGRDPAGTSTDPIATGLPAGLLAVAAGLLAALVVSLLRLPSRLRMAARVRTTHPQDPKARIRGDRRRLLVSAAGWAVGCAALAGVVGLVLPTALADGAGLREVLLWTPDLGWAIVAIIGLALAQALVRLASARVAFARRRPGGRHPKETPFQIVKLTHTTI